MNKYQNAWLRVQKSIETALSCLGIDLLEDEETVEALKTLERLIDEHRQLKQEYFDLKNKLNYRKRMLYDGEKEKNI